MRKNVSEEVKSLEQKSMTSGMGGGVKIGGAMTEE